MNILVLHARAEVAGISIFALGQADEQFAGLQASADDAAPYFVLKATTSSCVVTDPHAKSPSKALKTVTSLDLERRISNESVEDFVACNKAEQSGGWLREVRVVDHKYSLSAGLSIGRVD